MTFQVRLIPPCTRAGDASSLRDGGMIFRTIAAAMAAAREGDTVLVQADEATHHQTEPPRPATPRPDQSGRRAGEAHA